MDVMDEMYETMRTEEDGVDNHVRTCRYAIEVPTFGDDYATYTKYLHISSTYTCDASSGVGQ